MAVRLRRKPKVVDALSPLDEVVSFLGALTIFTVFLIAILVSMGGGGVFGMDREGFCVETKRSWSVPVDESPPPFGRGLQDRASLPTSTSEVCNNNPDAIDLALVGVSNGATSLVFVGFLFLTRRTIRLAREQGLFAIGLAVRIERMGRWLLLSVMAAAVIEWLARGLELSRLLEHQSWASGSFSIPYVGIVVAYIVITIGRVMARASLIQNELRGTV